MMDVNLSEIVKIGLTATVEISSNRLVSLVTMTCLPVPALGTPSGVRWSPVFTPHLLASSNMVCL